MSTLRRNTMSNGPAGGMSSRLCCWNVIVRRSSSAICQSWPLRWKNRTIMGAGSPRLTSSWEYRPDRACASTREDRSLGAQRRQDVRPHRAERGVVAEPRRLVGGERVDDPHEVAVAVRGPDL